MLKSIEILGLRGFGKNQEVNFALSNETIGSGLTVIVGANNSGKTTITEAIRYYNMHQNNPISFSVNKRNNNTQKKVKIQYYSSDGTSTILETVSNGGSETVWHDVEESTEIPNPPAVLFSRRAIDYELHGSPYESEKRDYYFSIASNSGNRSSTLKQFEQRIFNWHNNKEQFNEELYKVLDKNIEWNLDQNDNGSYFIQIIKSKNDSHTIEGLGDGIWSLFTIIDLLYDAEPNTVIVIDEPELSLHPTYQKKVMSLLLEHSKDKQIIISTHSPYFLSWESLENHGRIVRTSINEDGNIKIFQLKDENIKPIINSQGNYYNPHTWGLDAKELFFLEDNVIVVEGQEDVIGFNKASQDLDTHLKGEFFGWGAGGSGNIKHVLDIMNDIGFSKVVAIYDGDKESEYLSTKEIYQENYLIKKIWKEDIRDKVDQEIEGLLSKNFTLKEEHKKKMKELFDEINEYFEK